MAYHATNIHGVISMEMEAAPGNTKTGVLMIHMVTDGGQARVALFSDRLSVDQMGRAVDAFNGELALPAALKKPKTAA